MNVDRCVCLSVSFERLKAVAAADRLDFDGLKAATRCCTSCQMCEPYVRRMLKTGETVFTLDRKHPAPAAGITSVRVRKGEAGGEAGSSGKGGEARG